MMEAAKEQGETPHPERGVRGFLQFFSIGEAKIESPEHRRADNNDCGHRALKEERWVSVRRAMPDVADRTSFL
jgi:hypothetical protein